MKYEVNQLPKSEIEITVSLPPEEFEPHFKKAANLISEEIEIEGFRKGKAPYEIIKNKIGEMAIYERAAELAIKKTYPQVLEEARIKNQELRIKEFTPIGRPEITITKLAPGNELQYKAKIALLPEVNLPDYKSIAVRVRQEKKEVPVSDEEIEKTLKWIRESRAEGEGDQRKVPELTDEFAKSLGDFLTVEALKSSVRDGLKSEKEEREKERIRISILEEISQDSGIEVPDVLVKAELEKMSGELKSGVQSMGMKWEDYLLHLKKTAEDLKKEWRNEAEKRVRVALCLREIARLEKIEPSAEEIEARANQLLIQFRSTEEAEKRVDAAELREYTRGVLRNEKVFEFLEKDIGVVPSPR